MIKFERRAKEKSRLFRGMRPEEYLTLKWTDIDFELCTATVQRALIWHRKGGGFKFDETKTAKSNRTLLLPKSLMPKLKEHKRQQTEHRFKLGSHYENYNLVFANELGRPLNARNVYQRNFRSIVKKAELEKEGFVLYSLRHSCAYVFGILVMRRLMRQLYALTAAFLATTNSIITAFEV